MRKEVLLAIIFGIILGGIILYGINLANRSIAEIPATPTPAITNPLTPTPAKGTETLKIQFPSDNSVIFQPSTTIKGTSIPGSHIAILSESDDHFSEVDSTGSFSAEIKLISGENNIKIISFSPNEASTSAEITLIYTATQL